MGICGRELRGSISVSARSWLRGRFLLCLGIGLLVLAAGCPPAPAASGSAPAHPSPKQLWRAYPLDPVRASQARRQGNPRTTPRRESQSSTSTRNSQEMPWLLVAAALLAMLAAVATVAAIFVQRGERPAARPRKWPRTRSPDLNRRWFDLVDSMRSFGAMLGEEVGSIGGPRVEFATPAGPDSSGSRGDGDPKAQPAAVKTLKEKRRTADRDEVDLLKAKLGGTPQRQPVPLRPRRPQIHAVAPTAERCRIEWWRGYLKSEFYAQEVWPEASIVATSGSFRWSKSTPPPETLPHVARAHAELVAQLEAAGWEVGGRGEHWYSLELQRRPARAADAEREP